MKAEKKKAMIALTLIVGLLLIDQAIKVAIKLNMNLGESIHITDWFQLVFVENNGMAWGMEIGSKLVLSAFRIVAVGVLTWYLFRRIKVGAQNIYNKNQSFLTYLIE